ncbi:hypothetical protein GCM10012275_29860 [Longimycelium tulufanense]|uniref:Glycoside hydrolase family 42 N-terminal domain-containing protein n=1 Tax=Longimycelium tulufanense TaxID=907463 RepID=A0A8J3CD62_9PSEU|nr:hypothetical protein [Longimycelium tulufanense]GGM56756.1 hypothetical protein GCM10012275_29860 [Longimycelium tulufanense]
MRWGRWLASGVAAMLALAMAVGPAAQWRPAAASWHEDDRLVRQRNAVPHGGVRTVMSGGNTIGAWLREEQPRADGFRHIDSPAMVSRLKALGVTTYVFTVWEVRSDWDDLRDEFAPLAQQNDLDIWVYLVPPSECWSPEGRCSYPYELDFVAWGAAIAELSLEYPNITAWAIDDFNFNEGTFTETYVERFLDTQREINPELAFYVTAYFGSATDDRFLNKYGAHVDGLIYPYLGNHNNVQDPDHVRANVELIRRKTEPRDLQLIFLVYANRFLDAPRPPTEDYVDKVLTDAMSLMANGDLAGVLAYGTPLDEAPQVNTDHEARSGNGRVSLLTQGPTDPDDYAEVWQEATVEPDASSHRISFFHRDLHLWSAPEIRHRKEVLVNNVVVWSEDVTATDDEWQEVIVDLTPLLKGRSQARLAFRLVELESAHGWDIDVEVAFEHVTATGLTLTDPGFETSSAWHPFSSRPGRLLPSIDRYLPDRPQRIFNVVANHFGGDEAELPDHPAVAGAANRSMYGRGWLRLAIDENTWLDAGVCASATQSVPLDTQAERYEISFWHRSGRRSMSGHLRKEVLVNGHLVWAEHTNGPWARLWMNGHILQGPIDITEQVGTRDVVEVTLQACTVAEGHHAPLDVGFDTIETVGLDLRNADFETADGWVTTSTHPAMNSAVRRADITAYPLDEVSSQ